MASLYRKPRSPFWWVQFIDGDGRRHNESTKLRADDPNETAQARSLRKSLEAAEELNIPGKMGSELTGGWDYVDKYLEDYCRGKSPKTFVRYRQAWHWIGLFLAEHKIRHPRDVRFAHGQQFVDWRKPYKKRGTGAQVPAGRCDRSTASAHMAGTSLLGRRKRRNDIRQGSRSSKST